jgi:DtxR family Mn-dependent transcriptional regulator
MMATIALTTSMEDYMETILQLFVEKKGVRVSDIAERMEVSKPSVSGALQVLARQGLVNHEPYEVISLTAAGEKVARGILRRHEILKRFLNDILAIPEKDAEAAACGMEHAISAEVTERLARLLDAMARCPSAKTACRLAVNQAGEVLA